MRISERLTMLTFPVGQGYLWRDGSSLTLIDTGIAGSGEQIAQAVAGLGLDPADIERVVITHAHNDHMGSAAEVRGWHGAQVLAHRAEADVVRGIAPPGIPVMADWEVEIFVATLPHVPPAPPCPVDVELVGGEVLDFGGGAHVVPVPGHTDGSVAVFLPAHGVLFTGDTIAFHEGRTILGVLNTDPERAVASMRVQADLGAETVCFGHGEPLVTGGASALRAAVSRLE
ncbi:MBL fold metallo-hydrolase [Actinokineospora cianjurensis]|uniref:MBL fold metallo-hydrolase n=1 Tax=Actinokineospora cianjurensis TaxID=585224 RepID=UPI001B88022D|nr:MBL fold metallo-hydrolase [Actinokineospora cianjurensis]